MRRYFYALVLLPLLLPAFAQATTRTWDGGCGADTAWSCAANWSGDAVPAAADTVVFGPKSYGASTVDSAFPGTIAAIKLNPGFAGSVSLARPLVVSKSFVQKAGEFTAGKQGLSTKALTLGGGDFTASAGQTSISGSLKVTGTPSFDGNGGTVELEGGGASLSCGGIAFDTVDLSHVTALKTVGDGCDLPLGNDPDSGGPIKLKGGTLSGSGTLTSSGRLILSGGGHLSGFSGLVVAGDLTIEGTYGFGAYSTFSVGGSFSLKPGGGFVAPSGIASFAGNFTLSDASSFDANGGTLTFDGTANSKLSCGGKPFDLVSFEHTAGKKTVGPDCSLPLGKNPTVGAASDAAVNLAGSLSGKGTLSTQQTLQLSASASVSGFGGLVAHGSVMISGGSLDLGSHGTFAVEGSYRQTGGTVTVPSGAEFGGSFGMSPKATFNAPGGTVSFNGDFTVSPGAAFNPDGGTVSFAGNQSAAISCHDVAFNLVTFAHLAGTKTVGPGCDLPLGKGPDAGDGGSIVLNGSLSGASTLTTSGTLTLGPSGALSRFSGLVADNLIVNGGRDFGAYTTFATSGDLTLNLGAVLKAPSGTASISGDFVNEGSFVDNGGTVVLDGGDQRLLGATTFNNLIKTSGGAAKLTFGAGEAASVLGALTLKGIGNGLLRLVSSTPGTPWLLEAKGAREIRQVSVTDSKNTGKTITAYASLDGAGNAGWSFPLPTVPGTPTTAESPTKEANPLFTWTASTDGGLPSLRYEVQWSESNSFKSGAISDPLVLTNSCAISTAVCGGLGGLAKGFWYVRVRSFDAMGNPSAYSPTGSVHIN
jgi:hypothetical protein